MLFNYDSEQIHDATLGTLARLSRSRLGLDCVESFFGMAHLPVQLWGLRFPNPVGVAAGMDKQGVAVPAWAAFGFGFSELGGVTWHAQPGNPVPRMFRAIEDGALINRMGFNNGPGPNAKPILVKVAPDLSFDALDEILEVAGSRNLSGIVATNTTVSRPVGDERSAMVYSETGGLSGRPLRARSTEIVRHLYLRSEGKLPIIGVGGIFNAQDAWEKITNGASLVQVYTGMVYEGPGIARAVTEGLRALLEQSGMKSLQEAVGIMARAKGFPAAPQPVLMDR